MPAETYLLVFRDTGDQIQFTEINAFTSRLVSLLETTEYTGQTALEIIAAESRHPSPEVVIQGGWKSCAISGHVVHCWVSQNIDLALHRTSQLPGRVILKKFLYAI